MLAATRRVQPAPPDGPSVASSGYGLGWIDYTYTKGRRLIWRTGFWEGFGTFIGFFPEADLGTAPEWAAEPR